MRKKWFTLGCLSSILLLILLFSTIGYFVKKSVKKKKVEIVENSYLHLKVSGQIMEYTKLKDDIFEQSKTNAFDIVKKIQVAKNDSRIDGIIIEPSFISIGLATLNEIDNALKDFKKSGKEVYAYLEFTGNRDYLLASCADKIFLNPSASAGIFLTGVGGKRAYYKDTFEKIGLKFNVIHAGDYKGAGESYSRNSMSKPVQKNLNLLYDSIYNKMKDRIAENRNIGVDRISYIYEERDQIFVNKNYSIESGLVDELIYRDELLENLNISKEKLINIANYKIKPKFPSKENIALVFAQGQIMKRSQGLNDYVLNAGKLEKIFKNIKKDKSIKAVVLRVNSPGGSALESDIMWNQIRNLQKILPVVVSMGDVAASGGYYISSNADYIFADPLTITGSIGVVAMFPNISEFGKKIDLHHDGITRGKFAQLIDVWEPLSEQNKKAFELSIGSTYKEFKSRVSKGRSLKMDDVEAVAQGQVWASNSALDNGLIDKVGTIDDAIEKARELSKLDKYSVKVFPKRITLMNYLMEEKFNIKAISSVVKFPVLDNFRLNDKLLFLQNVKDNPVQAITPVEF